ncbi:hypothetical protein Tco_0527025 [Tanacetum coccineum]
METPKKINEPRTTVGTVSSSRPSAKYILGGARAQTRFEVTSKQSNDLPLSKVNTLRSGEDNMKLKELMEHYTKLSKLLNDAEGIDCLPTATIFTELERIGAKTTSWNEFSSTMAYAIICLATNQKFNLSKYIFDNMVKKLDGGVKFLMYPRFVQVFLDKQVEGMSKQKAVYVTPSHTKKVFANMKRPCNGFSGRVTPLFSTMMVQATEDIGEDSVAPFDSHSTPIISQPSSSKPQKKNLQEKVLDLEKAKTAQAKDIASLKKRVKQLEKRRKLRTPGLKKLRKIGSTSMVESSNNVSLGDQEDASK